MKKILIIANWKMYLDSQKSIDLAEDLAGQNLKVSDNIEIVICPMFTVINDINQSFKRHAELAAPATHSRSDGGRGSVSRSVTRWRQRVTKFGMTIGAQDSFWKEEGAYTGEVSPKDLKLLGCDFVIVGHSERREYLKETDKMINIKVRAVLKAGLKPILCIGEKLEERKAGQTKKIIVNQLKIGLDKIKLQANNKIIIAYEPIWAIYPSKLEVDPQEVEESANLIKQKLKDKFGKKQFDRKCQIIYGGSVTSQNINKFLGLSLISGALIGHASTDLQEFTKIIDQALKPES